MLHCNGIDPFATLMGNFNWGPISRNNIVSCHKKACVIKEHTLKNSAICKVR